MSNKKTTAVDWLLQQFDEEKTQRQWEEVYKQAKERHKKEIKESWTHGFDWGMMEQSLAEQGMESTLIDAEHFYEQTYGE